MDSREPIITSSASIDFFLVSAFWWTAARVLLIHCLSGSTAQRGADDSMAKRMINGGMQSAYDNLFTDRWLIMRCSFRRKRISACLVSPGVRRPALLFCSWTQRPFSNCWTDAGCYVIFMFDLRWRSSYFLCFYHQQYSHHCCSHFKFTLNTHYYYYYYAAQCWQGLDREQTENYICFSSLASC